MVHTILWVWRILFHLVGFWLSPACVLNHFSPVQLFVTPWTVAHSAHGILQERILEWVAMPYSRESSRPRGWTRIACLLHWLVIIYLYFHLWSPCGCLRVRLMPKRGGPQHPSSAWTPVHQCRHLTFLQRSLLATGLYLVSTWGFSEDSVQLRLDPT